MAITPLEFAHKFFRFALAIAFAAGLASPLCSWSANIVVTSTAPTGAGTLRAALLGAHSGDVITFNVTGTIINSISTGLVIGTNVSIVGPGPDQLTITGTNGNAAFNVSAGVTATISGLTIYQCRRGAINNPANLTVSNCVFTSCYVGGGINNSGTLQLWDSTFTDCRASYGSSTYSEAPPGTSGTSGFNGGAIYNSGTMTVVNCSFDNNTAGWGGTGTPGQVAIYSTITTGGNGGNGGHGGAVYDVGTASFTNCTFAGNTSGMGGSGGAGGSGVSGVGLQAYAGPGHAGGNAGNGGDGSAVWSADGGTFVSCTFYNNTTGSGGNGGNGGNAYIGYPVGYVGYFSGGAAGNAGNAGNGSLYCTGACQMVACTFYNNNAGSAGNGGSGGNGANNTPVPADNGGNGGNAGNGGSGGGIFGPTNASFTLRNVLVAQNTASLAGSAGSGGSAVQGTNGIAGANGVDGNGPDLFGKFTSNGHNLISLNTGSTGLINGSQGDIVGSGSAIDAMINSLADNGGPVNTCALMPGSPALDVGDDTLSSGPFHVTTDARGYPRKSGTHVDIGAYELQQLTSPLLCNVAFTANGPQLSVATAPGISITVLGIDDLTVPVANWNVMGTMTEVSPGVYQWTDYNYGNYDSQFYLLRSP